MDSKHTLNIEKAILSSVLFDCTIIEEVSTVLKVSDFYIPQHQKIFQGMLDLHNEDMPIDEDFLRKRIPSQEVSDNVLIEILTANPIANVMAYCNEIKQGATKRELASLATEIKKLTLEDNANNDTIIEAITDKIDSIKKTSQLQGTVLDFKEYLEKKGGFVTLEFLETVENTEMLFDGLIPYQQITTVVGEPNVGKSALTLALANNMLDRDMIDMLLYFDIDSPLPYTKDRIKMLINKNGKQKIKFYHGSTITKETALDRLRFLATLRDQGKKVLIVIDSLKDFITGSISSDEGANEMYEILKAVRDIFGASVIALHHTKKNATDDGKLEYIGSQAIKASTDNMLYVKRLSDNKIMTTADKMRAMLNEKMAFDIDFEQMTLAETDIPNEDDIVENSNILEKMEVGKDYTAKELGATFEALKELKELGEIVCHKDMNSGWVYKRLKNSGEPEIVEYKYDASIPDIDY